MTASSQFDELELDHSRFGLRHKGDNSRFWLEASGNVLMAREARIISVGTKR